MVPGSMKRAKGIADTYLTDCTVRESGRGHHAYLGTLKKSSYTLDRDPPVALGVISTGMGAPSVDIVVTELIKMGAKVVVRVGTAGAMKKGLRVGDLVVAAAAVRDEGLTRHYMPLEFPSIADPTVVTALNQAAIELQQEEEEKEKADSLWVCESGTVHTKDSLMAREFKCGPLADDHEKYMRTLEHLGCLASEMECSCLYTLGQVYGVKTGAVLGIIGGGDNPIVDDASLKKACDERSCAVVMRAMRLLKVSLDRHLVRSLTRAKSMSAEPRVDDGGHAKNNEHTADDIGQAKKNEH